MAISNMQQPRQMYGLGSFVKKIGRGIKGAVKSIAKSPIGKIALLGAATIPFGGPVAALKGLGSFVGGKLGGMNMSTKIGLGSAFATYLGSKGFADEEVASITRDKDKLSIYLKDYYTKLNPNASDEEIEQFITTNTSEYAVGGRVGLESGTPKKGLESLSIKDMEEYLIKGPYMIKYDKDGNPVKYPKPKGEPYKYDPDREIPKRLLRNQSAMGGLQSMPMGQMRRNQAGTIERDYRETGGFVPVGIKEKADDVPAMLSKNEFVMTADAVRGMGNGNIEKGAQRLYDQMKQAEKRVV